MRTVFFRILIAVLLLFFAYASLSLVNYDPLPLYPEEPTSAIHNDAPLPVPSPAVIPAVHEETIAVPEYIPPTLEPKPDYYFPDDFKKKLLESDWFNECPAPGTVEVKEYPATDYLTGKEISKNIEVYLPNGYTPEIKYDVLILTHGAGDDESYWFSEEHDYGDNPVNAKNLVDNMIYRNACRDIIIASVTCSNEYSCSRKAYDWDQLLTDGSQFAQEIANDILPYIAENYSTYASAPDKDSISEARDHFAYFGLSWSAMFGYLNILPDNMEYFSWYALIAPSRVNLQTKMDTITEKYSSYPVRAFYASVGANDQIRAQSELLYSTLITSEMFIDGENSYQIIIENVKHHFESWCTSLYNCLELFF